MRVAVDCHMVGATQAGDSGNGRYAAMLVNALAATAPDGDDAWALVAEPGSVDALRPGVCHAGLSANNVRRLLVSAPRALHAVRADLAVFTYVAPPLTGVPVALAVHDATFITHPQWLPARARIMLNRLVPRSARRAACVLALSHTAAAEISEAMDLDPARIRVVHPAVDERFRPDPQAGARVHSRHGLDRYCLAVGDLAPRKNLGALAAAVERLGDPGLPLVLVGHPGDMAPGVLNRPHVRWLGRVDDDTLADLYRAATVTAFPSLHEGFGLPAAEAMACGSPLVVSDRGALPEVVGDAALVVGTEVEQIAEGLRAALEPATADVLRARGPQRATAFRAEAMGEAAWQVFHQVHT